MTKEELIKIEHRSIEMQKMLYNRMKNEQGNAKEWTATQIAYQKSVYKAAMHELGGGFVVDGIKPVDYNELVAYFETVVNV